VTPSTPGAARVLVACVGNPLVADDAVGPAVYGILSEGPLPEGVRVELLAVGGVRLLDELRGERALVVVDAVRFGAPPGTVHVLPWDRIPESGAAPVTSHGIGVRETIDIGRLLYPERVPGEVLLVGVEGLRFDDIGGGMTPEVSAAVQFAAEEVLRYCRRRRRATPMAASGRPGNGKRGRCRTRLAGG